MMEREEMSVVGRGEKLLLIELCSEEGFTSIGTGTYTQHLRGPVLRGLGPRIEDIVVHTIGRSFSANFRYKVIGEWSYDGEVWTAFAADLLAQQTTIGGKISVVYNTRTDFGLRVRFKVAVSDTAAAKENGVLSITVAVRLAT